MDEENGVVTEQLEPTTANEATAAAAAFSSARNEEPAPVIDQPQIEEETPPATEPKRFAGRTEEEIEALLSEIPSMKDGYRKQIDNLAGNYGALKSAFQKLQQDTPKGEQVTVTDEDLTEMYGEFPELAGMTKNALNNVLKRVNLKGASIDPAAIDERVNTLVTERVSNERVAIHKELLNGLTPGWDAIVGLPDEQGNIPQTDYRKWLATQPADYQSKMAETNNAFEIGASIKAFQEAHATAANKQTQNKQRLTNAIQPSGSVAARGVISEQQAADSAFRRERGR